EDQSASRAGLDHGLDQRGDSRFAGTRGSATVVVGPAKSGRDSIGGLSRRAIDGVLQPADGRTAAAQAGAVISGDGERTEPNRQRSGAPKKEAAGGHRHRVEGGQGAGAIQDGQAL